MDAVILKAHFDGKHIMLDEPYELQPGTPVTVTVGFTEVNLEKSEWTRAASAGLERAYSDDEPEYTAKDIKS